MFTIVNTITKLAYILQEEDKIVDPISVFCEIKNVSAEKLILLGYTADVTREEAKEWGWIS